MQTSTLGAVSLLRRRGIRMALPLTMLLLVVAAAPVVAGSYDAEIALIRTDIEEKLDLITGSTTSSRGSTTASPGSRTTWWRSTTR